MILVTGASGFLGRAVCRVLDQRQLSYTACFGRRSQQDFRERVTVLEECAALKPQALLHLAYPGTDGIATMLSTPATLADSMLRIDLNVLRFCAQHQIPVVCVGSVCAYPEQVSFPTGEDQLWQGYPETLNAAYGIAKRMQLELLRAYHREAGLPSVHLILGNLYGPGDRSQHVIPATIRKVLDADLHMRPEVVVWGDGTATREFLYIDDAARAVVDAIGHWGLDPINIVSGEEVSIFSMAEAVCCSIGYAGTIRWDSTKPNGQPRRWFDGSQAAGLLGWVPRVRFAEGLQQTIAAMRQMVVS